MPAHPELRPKSRVSMKSDLSKDLPPKDRLFTKKVVVRQVHHERTASESHERFVPDNSKRDALEYDEQGLSESYNGSR